MLCYFMEVTQSLDGLQYFFCTLRHKTNIDDSGILKKHIVTVYCCCLLSKLQYYCSVKQILSTLGGGFRSGECTGVCSSYFLQSLGFCNYFQELQTELFEVELIINNAPLTYVYPNTIGTCLTPNHLLFGRQLFYFSNTTSTVVRNPTVLSNTTDKINRINNHFWDRRRCEYVVNLRETQQT